MHQDTKEGLCMGGAIVGVVVLVAVVMIASLRGAAKARGPKLFAPGQKVAIKTTGERTLVVGVSAKGTERHWHYWCRVAFGSKHYPIGVITNPTQITKTYELVDFYGFELEAR